MKKTINNLTFIFMMAISFVVFTGCDKTEDTGNVVTGEETIKDAEGNVYNTVKIGDQVWTVENLKTAKYNDGTSITNITDNKGWGSLSTGAYCNFDNLESNVATYGRLYNWYAVNTGKLAPKGWHVATYDDWYELNNYVAYYYGASGSVDKALAAKSKWEASTEVGAIGNNLTINNSTGFTALPGGYRDSNGYFVHIGKYGVWWISNEDYNFDAYGRYLYYKSEGFGSMGGGKKSGYSVRLVKDN